MSSARPSPSPLSVELHGDFGGKDVAPDNFDVVHAMNYVSALLDLLSALADKQQEPLSLQGMTLAPGSVVFDIDVEQPSTARRLVTQAGELVAGRTLAPRGLRARVTRVRESVSQLGPGVRSVVKVGRHKTVIAPPNIDTNARTQEEVELRARVFRVGGSPPRVWAITDVDGEFRAELDHRLAADIAGYLYQEVDLVATIERTDEGRIVDATVHRFFPLDETEDEAEVWRRWFALAGSGWEDIEDIEAELDRNIEKAI
ncbi:hypothetical protein [Enhygromyxa salina]|uniref:Uncharacterized protein n=1 Tax=Enhygromyxa salina TaxID=215803 RepID=A0A2S9YRW2_9BACT|nr:hypothetical protein [Enhygromyxa salina]PRQ07837.1 hypothetical protein ENSA7_25100 [Enhygromyxa salina]